MWFKRKPKKKIHILKTAGLAPYYKDFYSAVRCETCGKHYIMDTFGGWAVEYTYTLNDWNGGYPRVSDEDFQKALVKYHGTPAREWLSLLYDECV